MADQEKQQQEKEVQHKVADDIVGAKKFQSRKWRSIWIVEAILTIFIGYGALTYAENVSDLVTLLDVWVNFTLIAIIGYGTANIAEKWVTLKKSS